MIENSSTTATSASSLPAQAPTIIVERRNSPWLILGVLLIALAAGSFGAWYLQQQHPTGAGAAGASVSTIVVPLEGFTVNLADPEDNHFLRVTLTLALDRLPAPVERDKPASGMPMARVRDTILSVLTVSKADALLTPGGKQLLKKNLLDALNRNVPELGVRDVYFTEFLVQR